jgi:hypothetical protein
MSRKKKIIFFFVYIPYILYGIYMLGAYDLIDLPIPIWICWHEDQSGMTLLYTRSLPVFLLMFSISLVCQIAAINSFRKKKIKSATFLFLGIISLFLSGQNVKCYPGWAFRCGFEERFARIPYRSLFLPEEIKILDYDRRRNIESEEDDTFFFLACRIRYYPAYKKGTYTFTDRFYIFSGFGPFLRLRNR